MLEQTLTAIDGIGDGVEGVDRLLHTASSAVRIYDAPMSPVQTSDETGCP